ACLLGCPATGVLLSDYREDYFATSTLKADAPLFDRRAGSVAVPRGSRANVGPSIAALCVG
ncbi:unnamed protein product, partial [Amoebophrya sp. A120]